MPLSYNCCTLVTAPAVYQVTRLLNDIVPISSHILGLEAALVEFVQRVDGGAGLRLAHGLMHIEGDTQAVAVVQAGVQAETRL